MPQSFMYLTLFKKDFFSTSKQPKTSCVIVYSRPLQHVDHYNMLTIKTQPEIRLYHPKGWADCQTFKRTFIINSKTKSVLTKKGLIVVKPKIGVITEIFTTISPFKSFLLKTLLSVLELIQTDFQCVVIVYMP